jgi:hypothetical protein
MRYEYATPQWEKDLKQANYDPATNSLAPAKRLDVRPRASSWDRNNWAPRIGFAFSPTPKTVIQRVRHHAYFNRVGSENLLAENNVLRARNDFAPTDAAPVAPMPL